MLAKSGNLADAFAAAWHTIEIAQQVEPQIMEAARATTRMEAEVDEGPANWYLVQTYPGDDLRAMRWLSRRRFGTFRPMQPRDGGGGEAAFPGWLFVFVWDMDKMAARIRATPGVMGILCDPVTLRPAPIRDRWVQQVREFSWQIQERRPRAPAPALNPQKAAKPGRPKPRERKALDQLKKALRLAGISYSDDQWTFINALVPRLRIAVLQMSLRASTVEPSGSAWGERNKNRLPRKRGI